MEVIIQDPLVTLASSGGGLRESTAVATQPTHPYANAADVPPELYDLILYFMQDKEGLIGVEGEQERRNSVMVDPIHLTMTSKDQIATWKANRRKLVRSSCVLLCCD